MPRYFCDYCDAFLTHDSPAVRKQHNTGYKHKSNVKSYYMQLDEAQAQGAAERQRMEFQRRGGPPVREQGRGGDGRFARSGVAG